MMKKADLIVDLQYGSTGKGLIAGYLAEKNEYDVVICANMPNAGHTYIDSKGQKMIHKVLPSGVVSPKLKWAMLGPGSIFSINRLVEELDWLYELGYRIQVIIHPNACILVEQHKSQEFQMDNIGSTKQGAGAAMVEKINRNPEIVSILAKDNWKEIFNATARRASVASHETYKMFIDVADKILLEGSQGYSLGINQKFWPYCTSRECTPARLMSDMGIPIPMLNEVIGVARVHPIRVGGTSGGWYSDQEEITWEEVGVEPELTTVTQKQRRIATFSYDQMDDAIWECQPNKIFLNFCNYDQDKAIEIYQNYPHLIEWSGWGPNFKDVGGVEHLV